ncbi:inositol 1,4,5-trisphosphate receptor-interacting protein-like [Protopterus annectens]|uniref:inositol 1,4,5-trisphosphate receptor-interacting protein-like n=1 Tax=Protopterus annectens TaxID=7888 RepID=UPI001CFA7E27|nr:inositol 1,4,5-trisphosphate receptor-interacting protein-like [Protopterus annectens]
MKQRQMFTLFTIILCFAITECKKKKCNYQILSSEIEFPTKELSKFKKQVEHLVSMLVQKMRDLSKIEDPEIDVNFIRTGSSYEGLKVKPDVELDFMVPIYPAKGCKLKYASQTPDQLSAPGMYGFIDLSEDGFQCWNKLAVQGKGSSLSSTFVKNGQLSAKSVREWFQSLADKAANNLRSTIKAGIKFSQQGPARTLKVTLEDGQNISVDLVPAIPLDKIYLVPKEYNGATGQAVRYTDVIWRLSFSMQEKSFVSSLTLPPNSCHLKALQILKYTKEQYRKKSSPPHWATVLETYHLKTSWLHLLQEKTSDAWEASLLRDRVLDLIDYLIQSVENGVLHHFFIGNKKNFSMSHPQMLEDAEMNANLLDGVKPSTLKMIHQQLKQIKGNMDTIVTDFVALKHKN